MSYRIKSVAALTGLTTSTLRAWERRHGLVTPQRTRGGYRVYSEEDVARLARIKSLLDNGFKISEAMALVEREAPELPPADAPPESIAQIGAELRDALLDMDRPRASHVSGRLASLGFERRIGDVLLPALREVGDCWARGEASVAQEHFASAFIREKLAGMLGELDAGPADGREAVFAGLPGEHHEIGLLAAAVHLALRGWRVTYLGGDLPYPEIEQVLARRSPALLCTAMVQQQSAAECSETIRRLRSLSPSGTRIVIGGDGIPHRMVGELEGGVHLVPKLESLLEMPISFPDHV